MLRAIQLICFLALGFVVSMQSGCEKSDPASDSTATATATDGHDDHEGHDHDEHEHADTFGGAIAELEELAGTISSSMAKGDGDAAHNPLHEVGHVLEALPELAKKDGLSEEDQASVKGAVATLMDAYGEVDAIMHGEEGKSWDDVKEGIGEAVKTLTSFEHGHDHDDHDHDGDGKPDHE